METIKRYETPSEVEKFLELHFSFVKKASMHVSGSIHLSVDGESEYRENLALVEIKLTFLGMLGVALFKRRYTYVSQLVPTLNQISPIGVDCVILFSV